MDFNATIDLIIRDLDEAREIIDDLKKYPGVPHLQVELAKSKCKSAGEIIAFLKSYKVMVPGVIIPASVAINPPVVITPPVEIMSTPDKIIPQVEIIPTPDEITPLVEIKPIQPERKEELEKMRTELFETSSVADKFNSPASLNEQLGGNKSDDDVKVFLKTKPITNLYEAIGVNDKFLFIREIFNGNKATYNQAISQLDNVKNLSDALGIILSYTDDKIENEAVKQLLNLVKLKLPSNE
jgi:hypothetical protein